MELAGDGGDPLGGVAGGQEEGAIEVGYDPRQGEGVEGIPRWHYDQIYYREDDAQAEDDLCGDVVIGVGVGSDEVGWWEGSNNEVTGEGHSQ